MPEKNKQDTLTGFFVATAYLSIIITAVFIVGGGQYKAILMTNKETSIEEFRQEVNSFLNLTKIDNDETKIEIKEIIRKMRVKDHNHEVIIGGGVKR